jgi:hypothetical protein
MEMTYTETLVVTHCWCGISLAIPSNLERWARDASGRHVYCPLGHTFVFRDNFQDKLKRERREHQATRDLLTAEERSHSATKGHLTKAKQQVHRAEHGVCPHCNRSFQNLQRHVKTKHPEVVA